MKSAKSDVPPEFCLGNARLRRLDIGLSGASVFAVTEGGQPLRYLKTATGGAGAALRDEIARTRWLAQRGIRGPAILRVEDRPERVAMLTTAVPGRPADAGRLAVPQLIEGIARAVAALHGLPAADCPFDETITVRLARAAEAVAAGEVDPAEFEPRNRTTAPEDLLVRLAAKPPNEDIAVVHGDATLENIFVDDDGAVGFVDCGTAGRADRYTDLAVLVADIRETYGDDAAKAFIQAYSGGEWNDEKARYFSDLYELY